MNMNEKSKMAKDQQYKLLSKGERGYIEMTDDELNQKYKRPDLARRQYLTRIKYRVRNAIKEIAWLCKKLPDSQLEKIFHDEYIDCLFNISQKALDVTDWNTSKTDLVLENLDDGFSKKYTNGLIKESKRIEILRSHIKNLIPHCYSAPENTAFNELMAEYSSFRRIQYIIWKQLNDIRGYSTKYDSPMDFIRKKGLEEEYKSYESDILTAQMEAMRKAVGSSEFRDRLKKDEVPEEQIKSVRKAYGYD